MVLTHLAGFIVFNCTIVLYIILQIICKGVYLCTVQHTLDIYIVTMIVFVMVMMMLLMMMTRMMMVMLIKLL